MPRPPSALLVEGGERLTSSALSSLGWYTLDERKVASRPVWRHAVHADRWLAFDGEAWLCQTTDCLGQARGMLQLSDPKCGSPDRSLMPWKSPREHSATGWTVQPTLTCTAKTAEELAAAMEPPEALHLKSARPLPLDVSVDCLGWYRLSDKRLCEWADLPPEASDKLPRLAQCPVWVHAVHEDRWISCSDSGWWAQEKRNLGSSVGWLQLPCLSSPSPPVSAQVRGRERLRQRWDSAERRDSAGTWESAERRHPGRSPEPARPRAGVEDVGRSCLALAATAHLLRGDGGGARRGAGAAAGAAARLQRDARLARGVGPRLVHADGAARVREAGVAARCPRGPVACV